MDNDNRPYQHPFASLINSLMTQRSFVLGLILVLALIGFEMFNFSTTEYALADLLGEMRFAGIRWATILSLAFCGIDFAGVARLFTPDDPGANSKEMWFLFAAWLLAATLNALLTWWGVSMALTSRTPESAIIIDQGILSHIVPIFVSCVVWVTRILLISNLSSFGSRYFGQAEQQMAGEADYRPEAPQYNRPRPAANPAPAGTAPRPATVSHRPHPGSNGSSSRPAATGYSAQPARGDTAPRAASSERGEEPPASRPSSSPTSGARPSPANTAPRPVPPNGATRTPAPSRPQTQTPGRTPAPPPPPRSSQNRPSQNRPQPSPKPAEPEPEPQEPMPPEPEYIPDEDTNYSPYMPPAYHSLSARANRGNGNGNENGNGNHRS